MTTPAKGATWYGMKAAAQSLDINIHDEIGAWGITAAAFIESLQGHDGVTEINLSIHSPGGSVFDGLAIYNALIQHSATVNVSISGLAASAASFIAMAGDTIAIPEDAFMMVHLPHGGAAGTASDMRDYADLLDQAGNTLANIYVKKTGLPLEEVTALLSAETWMDGPECVEKGFADKLAEPVKMAATVNPEMFDVYAALPAKAKKLIGKIEPTAEAKQIESVLAAKRNREEIDAAVGDFADNEHIAPLIASGEIYKLTPEQAGDFILEAIGRNCTPSAPPIHGVYAGNGAIVRDVLQDALQARAGVATLQDRSNPYQQSTLLEMAKASLTQNGMGIATLAPMQAISAAFSHATGDFSAVLGNVAEKALLQGYETAPENWNKWCRKGEINSFHPASRASIGGYPVLPRKQEGAEYKFVTIDEKGETIVLATYGSIFSSTREAIINDDLSAFSRIPAAQGRAASRTIGDLAYSVLTSNAKLADGKGIFHADHGGNTITDALDVNGVGNARKIMRLQKDSAGDALNIAAGYLLVPAALESQAEQVIASTSIAGATNSGVKNPVHSAAEIVVESRLDANSADNWYMVAGAGDTVEVAFLNGVEAPFLEEQYGFETDGLAFKVRMDAGVAPMDYRGFVRGTGGMPA